MNRTCISRRLKDLKELTKKGFIVEEDCDKNTYIVRMEGPKNTLYEEGIWYLRIYIPDSYPFKSPSICFANKIFHPNIEESSGSICLDALNHEWTPLFDLFMIFDTFIPQLLTYPNPDDPFNQYAAKVFLEDMDKYKKVVAFYIKKYSVKDYKQIE